MFFFLLPQAGEGSWGGGGACFLHCSRKLQRRVLRQIASPIQHSITQHNITPQQDTPQQDPPQHHTPQQDIHRSKTPHLQTGLLYSYYILNYFLAGGRIAAP